jgi:hypothetical protein
MMSLQCRIHGLLLSIVLVCVPLIVHAQTLPAGKLGAFAIPRMATPPVIDGAIHPREWREALAIGGLASQNPGGNQLIMRPTTYYLAWDADNLYVACRTWIMPGYTPRVGGRAPGTVTAFDDGMEFNLKPMGANVPQGRADSCYKFFISCFGSDGDLARVSVGQLFRNWRPYFKTAVRMTAPGSAPRGGRWWEAEMVFPAKEFELVGPNRAGDTWKMLLAFNHIPGFFQAAVPLASGYFDPGGWPTFTLVENMPAVQVTMEELPGLKDGTAAVKISVFNPTAQPVTLNALAQFEEWKDAKTTSNLLMKEQTLTVAPGQTAEFALHEPLPRDLGNNKGGLYFRVNQGDRDLYRYYAFFTLGYPENWVKSTPSTTAFPLRGAFNPVRNNLQFDADAYYLDNPKLAQQVRYTITREGEAKPVATGTVTQATYHSFSSLLQLPALQEGTYTVEATMELVDGKHLGPVKTQFKKLDEAKAFAPWWKNATGNTERVIKPFTPLVRKGNTVSLWGRTYTLDALGLPAGIVSQGKPVLAAPARIVAVIAGKEQVIPLTGKLQITEVKPWRVSFKGQTRGAGLHFSATGSIEQDGLALVNLTYAPMGKESVRVDALRLEFPLTAEDAEGLLCIGPGGNFSSLTHIILSKAPYAGKQGQLWSTLDTGRGGSSMTVGSFYPDVWIGNERRGFSWWADSDAGWVPDDNVPAHEALRVGQDIVLRNNIIGKPFTVTAPRTVTFSYNASPFKPLPKGWRMALHSEDGTFGGPHKQRKDPKTGQNIDTWNCLTPPSYDPAEWSALWAEYKGKADEKVRQFQPFNPAAARNKEYVHTSLPLSGYGAHSSDRTVTGYFAPDWGDGNLNPSQQDYDLWLAERAIREGGLRTIYWDIFYVKSFAAPQSGMGYFLPDGRVQPTFNGFNLRRFMMRMYALMSDYGLTPGAQVAHSTNAYPLPGFPWIDAVLDGEWGELTDATPRDWVDYYPTDRMRVMSIAENFGVQVSWMSLFHIQNKERFTRVFRGFTDYQRLHDTWTGQDGRFPPDSMLEWGLNDERLTYIPYWRNTALTSTADQLLISTWKMPGRAIIMVFNNADQASTPRDVTVSADLKALGVLPQRAWAGGVVIKEIGANIAGGMPGDTPRDPDVTYDAATGAIGIPGLKPHTARYIGIRMQEPADVERIRGELASVGAQHSDALLDWGIAAKETTFVPAGKVTAVKCAAPAVQVAMWQLPDRVLLAVTNTDAKAQPVTLDVSLNQLGLVPQLPWQEFIRVRDFDGGKSSLDFYERKLSLGTLKPGQVRLVGIRRY